MCAKEMQLQEFQALEVKVQNESLKDSFSPKTGFIFPAQCTWKGSLGNRSGVGVQCIYGIQWKKCIKK